MCLNNDSLDKFPGVGCSDYHFGRKLEQTLIKAICCKRATINDKMMHSFNMQDQKQLPVLCNLIPGHKIFSFHDRKVRVLSK